MGDRAYWLDLFTPKTWAKSLEAGGNVSGSGGNVSGFRAGRQAYVSKIKPGDHLIPASLIVEARFIALRVMGKYRHLSGQRLGFTRSSPPAASACRSTAFFYSATSPRLTGHRTLVPQ